MSNTEIHNNQIDSLNLVDKLLSGVIILTAHLDICTPVVAILTHHHSPYPFSTLKIRRFLEQLQNLQQLHN